MNFSVCAFTAFVRGCDHAKQPVYQHGLSERPNASQWGRDVTQGFHLPFRHKVRNLYDIFDT